MKYLLLALACFFPVLATAQPIDFEQYKKQNRDQIYNIAEQNPQAAVDHFEDYLSRFPGDLESMYGLALAYAALDSIDLAVGYVFKSVETGLPFNRYLAGPRELTSTLLDHPEIEPLIEAHQGGLLHGPLLGDITDSSAKFWIRTTSAASFQVLASTSPNLAYPLVSNVVLTDPKADFTGIATLDGLEANTTYHYRISVNGEDMPAIQSFTTYPTKGQPAIFDIGFGGGAGYTPRFEHMWNVLAAHDLSAFLLLGDNVYIDHPESQPTQQYCYYRRQSRPEYRFFSARTPIYAIWDDHDFTTNDQWGGPETFVPEWKVPVWQTFKNNWNNPYYGGGPEQPGCWHHFSLADVDFFLLDGRYYRTDPNVENPNMLGPAQHEWLREQLKASTATFKVIASPVPWTFYAKGDSKDTWNGFRDERNAIFDFLAEENIEGVILLSADRHRSDAWKIERLSSYDFYEFSSSRLTNVHTHPVQEGSLFGYSNKPSFGKLTFDTTARDPSVTYTIYSIENEAQHSITVRRSMLED